MTNAVSTPDHATPRDRRDLVRRIPVAWKVAVVVAAVGWAFELSSSTTTTVNGVADCDGFDAGRFVVGGLIIALVVGGFATMRAKHAAQRLDGRARWVVAGVLLAAAAAYLVAGLIDPAGGAC